MKVICIDASGKGVGPKGFDIEEGHIYHVCDEFVDNGILAYSLSEDPHRDEWGFSAYRFIPLSEIDETEMVNEKQTINQ